MTTINVTDDEGVYAPPVLWQQTMLNQVLRDAIIWPEWRQLLCEQRPRSLSKKLSKMNPDQLTDWIITVARRDLAGWKAVARLVEIVDKSPKSGNVAVDATFRRIANALRNVLKLGDEELKARGL